MAVVTPKIMMLLSEEELLLLKEVLGNEYNQVYLNLYARVEERLTFLHRRENAPPEYEV